MPLKVTILGCGSSGGVPRIGGDWGACDPANPKNRRRRCSILVQAASGVASTNVLVDTSPDMRAQLLEAEVGALDGVLYTHEHADHTHGIDDLRAVALNMRKRIDIWANHTTLDMLTTRFSYCFTQPPGSAYPPILKAHLIEPGEEVTVKGEGGEISARPFSQAHGGIHSLGFRFGDIAYSSDLNGLDEAAIEALAGLEVWIVDALKRSHHPTHFSLPETLDWIKRLKPKRAILTNMHTDLDYGALVRELPSGVEPAYDGMVIEL